jgi:hypothetical protein
MQQQYSIHADPTSTVDLQNPRAVVVAIDSLMRSRFGDDYGKPVLDLAAEHLAQAYRGEYPGLLRCDTHYHDLRHALDCGLAMARLIDGHGMVTQADAPEHIDAEHALLGILLALYHDIGLLRRTDEGHLQGALLTPVHEARGVEFMRDYLSRTPLAHLADKAELIMITRLVWHMPPDIPPLDRAISCLLGTADIISQLADRCYLEKCRDFLFIEFSAIGLAGSPDLLYPDPETLLRKTPSFFTGLLSQRIHNEYADADRFMKIHFGGVCPYEAAINRNFRFLSELLVEEDLSKLSRQPQRVIDAKH